MATVSLPPGQRPVRGFPRFGTHGSDPPPVIPDVPTIEVCGEGLDGFTVDLSELADLPRTEIEAAFHCVAGWSATGLRWEGVAFRDFFRLRVEPALHPGAIVDFVVFVGLDGFRSIVCLPDAMSDDVLLAERLDDRPLEANHGAPVRLVSPQQYGFVSTKHLARVELHHGEPPAVYHPDKRTQLALLAVRPHRRARVWQEERHRYLPGGLARRIYHRFVPTPRAAAGPAV